MRAVKCPVCDVTASAAPSQGQLREEPLIYGQCYQKPSTICHWQRGGVISRILSLGSLSPPRPPPTRCFCEFSCLFVCLFCFHVGFAVACSVLHLPPTKTHKYHLHFHKHKQTHLCETLVCSGPSFLLTMISRRDDAGRLFHGWLINMINSASFRLFGAGPRTASAVSVKVLN